MKKQSLILCVLMPWLVEAKAQYEVVNVPDRGDTSDMRIFQFDARVSVLVPRDETNDMQKNRLGDRESAASLFSASIEMRWFVPWWERDHAVEPHFGISANAYPSLGYTSSRMSLGILIRPNVTLGFSAGSYYRRVPDDGNFVNQRSQQFDNYPLYGGYIQAADKNVSMLFTIAFERGEPIVTVRASSRIGATLGLEGLGKTLQIDFARGEFAGPGYGFSFEPTPQFRLQVLRITPDQNERNRQARIGNKLTSGFLVSASVYVN